MRTPTKMKSKFRGHCSLCLYTIWQGEVINYNGTAQHLDCESAIKDSSRKMKEGRNQEEWNKINQQQYRSTFSNKILDRRS